MHINLKTIIFAIVLQSLFLFAEENVSKNILDNKCKNNDMHACHKLGKLYRKEKNDEKLKYYYTLVCDNNISDGCMSLATYYHLKNRKYVKKAFEYYRKACNLNNAWACNNLGNYYRYGKVLDKNVIKAIALFEKAYCLGDINKPYRNRMETIETNQLLNYTKDEIDCIRLQIDESMHTGGQIDPEASYQ